MADPVLVRQGIERREQIVQAILDYHAEHGFSPSIADCAEVVGISVNMTKQHINRLVEEGRVSRLPGVGRSLVVTEGK